jgi:hypothetical protein
LHGHSTPPAKDGNESSSTPPYDAHRASGIDILNAVYEEPYNALTPPHIRVNLQIKILLMRNKGKIPFLHA